MSGPRAHFRLYVWGDGEQSQLVITHVTQNLSELFDGSFELEVIDAKGISQSKGADDILVTPTLQRISPAPMRRAVGDLHNKSLLFQSLLFDITDL